GVSRWRRPLRRVPLAMRILDVSDVWMSFPIPRLSLSLSPGSKLQYARTIDSPDPPERTLVCPDSCCWVKPPAVPTTGRTFWSTNLESRARIRGSDIPDQVAEFRRCPETERSQDSVCRCLLRFGDISEHIACANQAPMVSRSVPRLPSRFTPGYHGFHSPLRPEKPLTGNRQMAKKKRKPPSDPQTVPFVRDPSRIPRPNSLTGGLSRGS